MILWGGGMASFLDLPEPGKISQAKYLISQYEYKKRVPSCEMSLPLNILFL